MSVRERREALLASAATTTFSSPTLSSNVADEKYNVLETGKTSTSGGGARGAAPGTFQLPKLRSAASAAGAGQF